MDSRVERRHGRSLDFGSCGYGRICRDLSSPSHRNTVLCRREGRVEALMTAAGLERQLEIAIGNVYDLKAGKGPHSTVKDE